MNRVSEMMVSAVRVCIVRMGRADLLLALLVLCPVVLRIRLREDAIEASQHRVIEAVDVQQRLDVLAHLVCGRCAEEHGAHVLIVETPCDGKLGHAAPDLIGNGLQLAHGTDQLIPVPVTLAR